MPRSLSNAALTERMLDRLTNVLAANAISTSGYGGARPDAESLRRISMTLHRWHELECGISNGHVERDEETGKTYWVPASFSTRASGVPSKRYQTPDREAGALKRLAAIMQRYPSLSSYVQGDPRGAALYILRPTDVPAGEKAESYYSRGLAVHQ